MRRGLTGSGALELIESMPITVASRDFFKDRWEEADALMGKRDRSDVPLVALALTIEGHDGIWSTDKGL